MKINYVMYINMTVLERGLHGFNQKVSFAPISLKYPVFFFFTLLNMCFRVMKHYVELNNEQWL